MTFDDVLQIYPHGSTDSLPYATMGSGSLAAMSIFESKYKEGLTVSKNVMVQKSFPVYQLIFATVKERQL